MRVLKFGGSSLANAKRFLDVAKIITNKAQQDDIAVVVSAPQGITNHLVYLADNIGSREAIDDGLTKFQQASNTIVEELSQSVDGFVGSKVSEYVTDLVNQLDRYLEGAHLLAYCPDHINARIISLGERVSVAILEELLSAQKRAVEVIEPAQFLYTNNTSLNAIADLAKSKAEYASKYSKLSGIGLMPGFIGTNVDGQLTTLGRNGSDYSAAVLAVCAQAEVCEIWTDVSGVYNADPRAIPSATVLDYLSYQEAMELSYFGAKVLHPKTIGPLAQHHIKCYIKNTSCPEDKGTLIGNEKSEGKSVKAISNLDDLTMINVSGPGMKGMVGMASRVFEAMSHANISTVMISQSSSEYCISFCVHTADAKRAKKSLHQAFELELFNGLLEPIKLQNKLSIISLIGDGMQQQQGVAAKLFSSLAQARVNVIAIAQDSSERSISVVVEERKATDAIKVCHQNFFSHHQSIDVFLVGCGVVGSELIEQVARQQKALAAQNIDLTVYGIANSKGMSVQSGGIDLSNWQGFLNQSESRIALQVDEVKDFVRKNHLINPVLVDCTSNEDLAMSYVEYLEQGFHVVTPNKKANTDSWEYYQALRNAAQQTKRRFLYETTVGAGLPVIDTLQNLFRAGDELHQFQGILSGSLSYIFGKLDEGMSISQATAIAKENGFTEPDPRDDLSGMDVARKLLILAREAGMELELSDIDIEPVLPKDFDDQGSISEFMTNLESIDEYYANKVSEAKAQGKVLRYIGNIVDGQCKVTIEAVDGAHPLNAIKDGENALAIHSRYYQPIPFVLRGYGAGAAVTAAGVFGDLLRTLAWEQVN